MITEKQLKMYANRYEKYLKERDHYLSLEAMHLRQAAKAKDKAGALLFDLKDFRDDLMERKLFTDVYREVRRRGNKITYSLALVSSEKLLDEINDLRAELWHNVVKRRRT